MELADLGDGGDFTPRKIATALPPTTDELVRTVGLGRDALQREAWMRSARTQRRRREMVEILDTVAPRFAFEPIAYAWYRTEPLVGFAGQTPTRLVLDGRATDVLEYIDSIDAGSHR